MEAQFERLHVKPNEGRTLIVGSRIIKDREDRRKRYADVVGIDLEEGEGVDRVLNFEQPLPRDLGKFAHIECCSVLEHSRKPWLMAANIEKALEPGGTLYVAAPFAWRVHHYPGDFWRFTIDGVKELFPGIEWKAAAYASYSLDEGPKLPLMKHKNHPHIARSMACLFGVRKGSRRAMVDPIGHVEEDAPVDTSKVAFYETMDSDEPIPMP